MVKEKVTGLMIYYLYVCKRKLWMFLHNINMENENEDVQMGKYLDESSYNMERKHISINNEINIDYIKSTGVIHEIKKSRKIEEASIWQVKYYIYYLKKRGVELKEAKIDYPLLKQVICVNLSEEDISIIESNIEEIESIQNLEAIPVALEESKCKKCAFFDLCFV